jgi:hypothetical protein
MPFVEGRSRARCLAGTRILGDRGANILRDVATALMRTSAVSYRDIKPANAGFRRCGRRHGLRRRQGYLTAREGGLADR